MGRKLGFSFSWKRASGFSAAKGRISRDLGIPLTRSGRQRKIGRIASSGCCFSIIVFGATIILLIGSMGAGPASAPTSQPVKLKWFYASWKDRESRPHDAFVRAEYKLAAANKAKDLGAINPSVREATRKEIADQEAEAARVAAQPGIMDPAKKIKVGDTIAKAIEVLGPTEHEEKQDGGGIVVWWRVYESTTASGTFNAAAAGGQGGNGRGRRVTKEVQATFGADGVATEVYDRR